KPNNADRSYSITQISPMSFREFHYRWTFDLKSPREKLWPFVADTNQFNHDTGVPALELGENSKPQKNGRRRLRLKAFGVPIEWEESPFEWVRPERLGVTRTYSKGPVAKLVVLVQLEPRENNGTRIVYEVWATPKSLIGIVAIPFQIGLIS